MENILIGKILVLFESVNVASVFNIVMLILWILVIRYFKLKYQHSVMIALCLLFLSMVLTIVYPDFAGFVGEYAFIFLGVGILQICIQEIRR